LIEEESRIRLDFDESIIQRLENDVIQLKQEFEQEAISRESNEQSTFDGLRMCLEKLKKRFDNQKRKRLDRDDALSDLI
jgi:hypothetical protein